MISQLMELGFLGMSGGLLLCGVSWVIGFGFSLACNIFKNLN